MTAAEYEAELARLDEHEYQEKSIMSDDKPHNGDDHSWLQTYTGRQFWPLDPRAEDVHIEDIAHALALNCRYTGHCRWHYSVAQHSIYVSQIVREMGHKELALTALLHDASEAYMLDLARPSKKHCPQFVEIEHRLEQVIADRFSLVFPFPEIIKTADNIALATERRDLMPNPPRPWKTYGVEPLAWHIEMWHCRDAERRFLQTFRDLKA